MSDYLLNTVSNTVYASKNTIPQTQPVSENQVKNSANGFTFEVDDFTRLNRFLMIGTQGGTFYQKESDLTKQNIDSVVNAIKADPMRVALRVYEVSTKGLALRQNPTLLVWALLLKYGDEDAKNFVASSTPAVARTATMLFQLATYIKATSGWSRRKNRAIGSWYVEKGSKILAYQIAKYPSRNRWAHLDMIRVSHPKATDPQTVEIFRYLRGDISEIQLGELIGPNAITGSYLARRASTNEELVRFIKEFNLSWEMIPTEKLNESRVWDALVPNSGYAAVLRNLNRLSSNGWLQPSGSNLDYMVNRLTNKDFITASNIHPFAIYLASKTYRSGSGRLGKGTWPVMTKIVSALDDAFMEAFVNVEPTGLRHLLALDVSGSMTMEILPGVSAMEASAALALIALKTEPNVQIVAFSDMDRRKTLFRFKDLSKNSLIVVPDLNSNSSLSQVYSAISNLSPFFTGTDCAAPFVWASEWNYEFDAFTLYTDSETWAGKIHPHVALKNYRESSGIDARSMVVAMSGNRFSIADPNDPGMLDVSGLDASLPQLSRSFFMGEI